MSDETVIPTPDQVEKVMLDKDKESNSHILDTYAGYVKIFNPVLTTHLEKASKKNILRVIDVLKGNNQFSSLLKGLNLKSIIRLFKMWTLYPLEETQLTSIDEKETKLYENIDMMLCDKYTKVIYDQTKINEEYAPENIDSLNMAEKNIALIANRMLLSKYIILVHSIGEQIEKQEELDKEKKNAAT